MLKTYRLILAIAITLQYQIANAQDLFEIYQLALKNDPVLSSAQNENIAAQELLVQGKALFKPSVNLSANLDRSETNIEYIGSDAVFRNSGNESFNNYGYGLEIKQPIYRKELSAEYAQAEIQVQRANLQLLAAEQNLILRSSQAYFDVLLAQDNIDLIQAQKSAIAEQQSQAVATFDAGLSTITEVRESQARLDLVEAQEIAAINQLQIKQRALQLIIGTPPKRLATLTSITLNEIKPRMLEEWMAIAERNNLTLAIQKQALELADKKINEQQAGHYPRLNAVGSYRDNRANNGINGFGNNLQSTTFGLQLEIPLYQGGAINSKVRQAIATKMKAYDDVETVRRQVVFEISQAYLDNISLYSQLIAYEQAIVSSQSQLDATTTGFEVGLRTNVDVLNAQQQLFLARRDLLKARYDYLFNLFKLQATAGLLNIQDVLTLNQLLSYSSS